MMKAFALALIAASAIAENVVLIRPESDATGPDVGVVWIQGANYSAGQYTQIAQQFQLKAKEAGYRAYIGIPDFLFSTPNPAQIGKHISSVMESIENAGFEGDNWFIAAHSLGGVMTQDFLASGSTSPDASLFKGQILMSSTILRKHRSIEGDEGLTTVDFDTPTLTIGASRDGLMRISRVAEAQWHSSNANDAQSNRFPVEVLDGVAHHQFASAPVPDFVAKNDLKADVSDEDAYLMTAEAMTTFVDSIISNEEPGMSSQATVDYLKNFTDAMDLEGSYAIKDACYDSADVNPISPYCLHGSPWVDQYALPIMVGELADSSVTLVSDDNFHRASTVYPYHHPFFTSDCDKTDGPCTITHVSGTENIYDTLNELDLGKTPIGAKTMRVKMKSATSIRIAAREADADFDTLDNNMEVCQRINQAAIDWAYERLDATAKSNYDSYGEKLVAIEDKEQGNGGLWIIQDLKWKEAKDKSEMDVQSVALILPESELVPIFKSMHYCKLLSPFRALEWMYVDSQYALNGYQSANAAEDAIKFLAA